MGSGKRDWGVRSEGGVGEWGRIMGAGGRRGGGEDGNESFVLD